MRLAFARTSSILVLAACNGDQVLPDPTLETAPPAPPACAIIYVSPNGNDASDGCKKEGPKKTIASAYATLKSELHVCHGAYPESLILDRAIALHGGYDCGAWQLDAAGETVIVGKSIQALTVSKSAVDTTASIDGFTFRAPASSQPSLPAVSLGAGTAVHFTSNRVQGGTGLFVGDGALPEIAHCAIDSGLTLAGAGRAWVHDNTIHAGPVNAALSISHSLDLVGDIAVAHNEIAGTVLIDATKVELQGNRIDGGGVTVTKAPFAHLIANRIAGGRVSLDAEDALVANNMILGGAIVPAARGVKVFQNTIVAGSIRDTLVSLTSAGPGAFVSGNLLIDGIPFSIDADANAPAELADNVFVTGELVPKLPAVAHGNRRFAAACGSDGPDACTALADCAEATHEKCAPAVLSPWDAATGGHSTLWSDGFVPKSDASVCGIIQKESAAAGGLQIDANGAPRSTPVSAGAVEVDGVACP